MENPQNHILVERRIAFAQTDAAGLIHFSTYFTLMEEAEAELFRSLDLPLLANQSGRLSGFPRVDCHCMFRRPLRFDDLVRIELKITRIRTSGLYYAFRFLEESGEVCAEGSMVTVYVEGERDGALEASPLPERIRSALENWKNLSI